MYVVCARYSLREFTLQLQYTLSDLPFPAFLFWAAGPHTVGLMALCNAASLLYAVSQVPIERRPSVVHPNVTPFVVNRWTGIQGQDPESADNNFVREHNLLCMVELNWGT